MRHPKRLVRKIIRRLLVALYGEHPLDRVSRQVTRLERSNRRFVAKRQFRDLSDALDEAVATLRAGQEAGLTQVLSETASGLKRRDDALSKLKDQAKDHQKQIERITGYLGDDSASKLLGGQYKEGSLPEQLEAIAVELDGLCVALELAGENQSILAQDVASKDHHIRSLVSKQNDLLARAEQFSIRQEEYGQRFQLGHERLEEFALQQDQLLRELNALGDLLRSMGDVTSERIDSLGLQSQNSSSQIEDMKHAISALEQADKTSELEELQKAQLDLREQLAGLVRELKEMATTSSSAPEDELQEQARLVESLREALNEADIAAGRDRRLLHDLRSWSESVSSLDLGVRLAQWERAQASLEKLEAKLESLTEGVEDTQEAGRKIADQVRRSRARLDSLETAVGSGPAEIGDVSQYKATVEGIEQLRKQADLEFGLSSDRLRKVENLNRRTRDLVRRHIENHHTAGFRPDPWLQEAQDRHQGERCFLVGSGPSLAKLDVALLDGAGVIMTVNGAAQYQGLVSDYFMSVAHVWWTQHLEWLESQDVRIRRFLPTYVECSDEAVPTSRILVSSADEAQIRGKKAPMSFGMDPASQVFLGGTVIFPALQVLHYLGFQEVVLLGIDHCYGKMDHRNDSGKIRSSDLKHYKDDYYPIGKSIPCDIQAMERAYKMALQVWQSSGRRLVNATPGTQLDIIPVVQLDQVLGNIESDTKSSRSKRGRKAASSPTERSRKSGSKKSSKTSVKKSAARKRSAR